MDREELVKRVREAAMSIIDNAESIVGFEKYRQKIDITIDVDGIDRVPVVTVRKDIIPERYLDRITEINEIN